MVVRPCVGVGRCAPIAPSAGKQRWPPTPKAGAKTLCALISWKIMTLAKRFPIANFFQGTIWKPYGCNTATFHVKIYTKFRESHSSSFYKIHTFSCQCHVNDNFNLNINPSIITNNLTYCKFLTQWSTAIRKQLRVNFLCPIADMRPFC